MEFALLINFFVGYYVAKQDKVDSSQLPPCADSRFKQDALFAEQTTKQPTGEEVYRAALQSLHQLVMNWFRRTATYLSNG